MDAKVRKQRWLMKFSPRVLTAALVFAAAIAFAALAAHPAAGKNGAPRPANAANSAAAEDATPANVNFKVLYTFKGGSDGALPVAPLIRDTQGNLYGTTSEGGATTAPCGFSGGCGVVFELSSSGKETVLYAFTGPDGSFPTSGLAMDAGGNLYGTTEFGGSISDVCYLGCGVVFRLSPPIAKGEPWTETVLHSFGGTNDGQNPFAGLTLDGKGNAYGTTFYGGFYGEGILFELDSSGMETILYTFCQSMNNFGNCYDGNGPAAAPILDSAGNLYGTTAQGGSSQGDYGFGTVYMFTPAGKESVLYSFQYSPDGAYPDAGLIQQDAQGNFYGTTAAGGNGSCAEFTCGTAFELNPQNHEVVLHSFMGDADGGNPLGPLLRDSKGSLFGTTAIGGLGNCMTANQGTGCGTIFEILANGTERVIYTFNGGLDGAFPQAGLITDGKGHAYGTSAGNYMNGSYGYGTVFEISQ